MDGLAESGSSPTQAILILANTVRIYLKIRAGTVSNSSGFYGYLNTQQRICTPRPAITLTWMEVRNIASFLKDIFHQCILSGSTKWNTYLHLFYKLGNQHTQRCNSTKWKASSPDRSKSQATWAWCALLQCIGETLKSHSRVESWLLPSNLP